MLFCCLSCVMWVDVSRCICLLVVVYCVVYSLVG